MDIYFDIEHLVSFIKRYYSHPNRDDLFRLLKSELNIKCTFDNSSLICNLKRADIEQVKHFLAQLTTGRGKSEPIKYTAKIPQLRLNHCQNQENPLENGLSDIYMVSNCSIVTVNDRSVDLCEVLLSPSKQGDEVRILENLFIEESELSCDYLSQEMDDWNIIDENRSLCTDIIIVDKYIFSENDAIKDANIYSILEILTQSQHIPTNIIIFATAEGLVLESKQSDSGLINTIKRIVKTKTGIEPNVTFVKCDSLLGEYKRIVHDRHIITNYKHFESRDSFNYFEGPSKPDTTLSINSLCKYDKFKNINLKLQKLQQVIDYLTDKPQLEPYIVGDKKSNYLIFN